MLKSPIQLNTKTITNSLKSQGLKPITCIEIPIHTKYPVYKVTFSPGITLANVNQVRFIEHIKVYWEKFESRKPTIQCYRCKTHGHFSMNCNKNAVYVKCVGPTTRRSALKPQTPRPPAQTVRGATR